jgi:hypothetical protein
MRNYEMVLQALKSGEVKSMADLKAELPDLQVHFMHKYVARAKYLAGAEIELMKAGAVIKTARAKDAETLRLVNADKFKSWQPETKTGGSLYRKANPTVAKLKTKAPKAPKVVKTKAPKAPKAVAPAVKTKAPKAPKAPKAVAPAVKTKAAAKLRMTKDLQLKVVPAEIVSEAEVPVDLKPVVSSDKARGDKIVAMIREELKATEPKGKRKAAALPRGPAVAAKLDPVKVERVSDDPTIPLKDPDDLLEIPEFLQIKREPKLVEE